MELKGKCCYSRLLWLMTRGELFTAAVYRLDYDAPNFEHEGLAGFIETKYTIYIRDISAFARLWDSWHALSDTRKLHLYGLAKGLGDCR